jgi:biotin---protein ligase
VYPPICQTPVTAYLSRNPWFLSHVPAPFLSLASYQLEGRGRGTNTWLSPSGCLQFSLLLRVPFSSIPANKLVFVQYLFGLAVAEACRDKSVLGTWGDCVRLKWPNDLYVLLNGELKKVGGVLVNTSFSGGKAEVIIGQRQFQLCYLLHKYNIVQGCGLNLLTPPPIASLSRSVPSDIHIDLRLERTVATIMTKFGPMWNTFIAHCGSFDPFMDLYLQRWLHSYDLVFMYLLAAYLVFRNQIVTLTTTTPEKKVRITGITNDYGLLRTIPEGSHSWSNVKDEGFIDLQPDGNSFDIMSGLIKAKT